MFRQPGHLTTCCDDDIHGGAHVDVLHSLTLSKQSAI